MSNQSKIWCDRVPYVVAASQEEILHLAATAAPSGFIRVESAEGEGSLLLAVGSISAVEVVR